MKNLTRRKTSKINVLLLLIALASLSFCTDNLRQHEDFNADESVVTSKSNIDITFYHLNLEINPNEDYYKSKVICKFKVLSTVNTIALDLIDALKVTSIEGKSGSLSFTQSDNKIHIVFPKKLEKKSIQSITIYYEGKPQTIEEGGTKKGLIYETHGNNEPVIATLSTPFLSHYWFPCKDDISDKADSVYVDIILPDTTINDQQLVAVSNGRLEAELKLVNNRKIFKWRHSYPIAPCYVFFAISNYQKHTEKIEDNSGAERPIDFYLFHEDYVESIEQLRKIKYVIKFFIKTFGNYPFDKEQLAFAQIGFYSGIETQTCPIVENFKARRFYTMIHEFAHAWFANSVTAKSWEDAWLHEGFATYAEILWDEYRYGKNAYRQSIQKIAYRQKGRIISEPTDNPFEVFSGIVYNKGAYVLHMLRGVVGDDIFFDILKTYTKQYQFKNASTKDFKKLCEAKSGQDLDSFFEQWLYQEGHPVYNYTFYQNPKTLDFVVNLRQSQIMKFDRHFEMPIQLLLDLEYRDTIITINNTKFIEEFVFQTDQKLLNIILDPNEWLLKEVAVWKHVLEINNSSIYEVTFENSLSGRTIDIMLKSAKTQKAEFIIKDVDENIVFQQDLKAAGTSTFTIEVPRNVLGGFHTMMVESKYERYYKDLMILD